MVPVKPEDSIRAPALAVLVSCPAQPGTRTWVLLTAEPSLKPPKHLYKYNEHVSPAQTVSASWLQRDMLV